MTVHDIALAIWLSPFVIAALGVVAVGAGMAAVEGYRLVQRWQRRGSWARRAAARQWWDRNRLDVMVLGGIMGWVVVGFLMVVWLNGRT